MRFQDLIPYHNVEDTAKFDALVMSIKQDGWIGAPLVVHNGHLLNGSHRWAAACEIARDDYQFELPVIELLDAFESMDEDELSDICECDDWQVLATALAYDLDADLVAYYGLDIH
jgi:hypothetical protein